jgi:glucose-1-phosphatase
MKAGALGTEPASRPRLQALLFDLGGVLVQFDGITPLLGLSENRLSKEEARRFWLGSPSVRAFETGTHDCIARANRSR